MRTLVPCPHYPVRDDIIESLQRYIDHGILPGSFLTAVLENNLSNAVANADPVNLANLRNIVGYVYNYLPSVAWGSRETVADYLLQFIGDK